MQILMQKADGQELHNSLFLASDLSAYHLSYSAWSREMHGGKASSCRDIPSRDGDHMAKDALWHHTTFGRNLGADSRKPHGVHRFSAGYRTSCKWRKVTGGRQNKPTVFSTTISAQIDTF